MSAAVAGFAALLLLVFAGLPVAFALMLVGVAGFAWLVGWQPALAMVGQITFDTGLSYSLSVVPLFILMGNFVARAGMAEELYAAAHAWLGHRRGGLALATVVACGGFSAVCGSSLATAGTMAKVALPSMRRFGYDDSLATGAVAAGGTLGILIPPSIVLVLYGIITEQDIGKLFAAGVVPGLLGVLGYMAAVAVRVRLNPALAPGGTPAPWSDRLRSLRGVWGILALFLVVMSGIYLGWFTPTEAAGIGAAGAFAFVLARGGLTWAGLYEVLLESARTTVTVFAVLIGALMFSNFLNVAGFTGALMEIVRAPGLPPLAIVAAMLAVYVVLGCALESLSMILLTVPVFFPLVLELGFDPIWFGILVVVITEISLITPPIGLNVFVLRGVMPDVPLAAIFRGVAPFLAADLVRLALILLLPGLALWLPSLVIR